jgi:Na+-transporting NADH:ubiquinone oxidoreductase subunit NqrC
MFTMTYLLFYILLMLFLGAVIAFSYFVIKPLQTQWAIVKARKILAENNIENTWQFRNVYRMLSTARNDLEAAKLWQQLDEMKKPAVKPSP